MISNNKDASASKSGIENENSLLKIQKKFTVERKPHEPKRTKPFSLVDAGGIKEEIAQSYQSNQLTTTNTNPNTQENNVNANTTTTALVRCHSLSKPSIQLMITSKSSELFNNKNSPFTLNDFRIEDNNTDYDNYNRNSNANNGNDNGKRRSNYISFGLDEGHSPESTFDISMNLGVNNNELKELFHIIYERSTKIYSLKSLTSEYFFSHIIAPYHQIILEDQAKNYFKIGKIILVISPKLEDHSLHVVIKKGKSMNKEEKEEVHTFTKDKFPVLIGRSGCSINLSCKSLSKSHATLDIDIGHNRFFFVDNASTNGSQLLLNKGKRINLSEDRMFNINDLLFSIKEVIK